MDKKNDKPKSKLSIDLFANLQRHPSVKGLFDEDGKMKTPSDSKDEYLLLAVNNKNEQSNIIPEDNNNKNIKDDNNKEKKRTSIPVKINRVEEKLVDNKETFFVEMNDEQRKEILKKNNDKRNSNSKLGKPLSYEFNQSQKEFDKDVTDAMSKGTEYKEIEGKFANQLKKK